MVFSGVANREENCDVTKFKFVKLWDWMVFTKKKMEKVPFPNLNLLVPVQTPNFS